MLATNIAAVTINPQAAIVHGMRVATLHTILASLHGQIVTVRSAGAPAMTGYLTVGPLFDTPVPYMRRDDAGHVVTDDRRGFTMLVQFGDDFTALAVWQSTEDGTLDLASLGRDTTITV